MIGDEQGGAVGEGPDGAAAVLHLPLSDVAVLAQSPFLTTGCATAMDEPAGDCGVGVLRGDGRDDGGGGHGGKDSLVKAPGTLVVSVYAGCPDISLRVTPDIKHAGRSSLVFVDHPVAEMLPEDLRVMQALDRMLRLLSVGNKRFLWLLWLL